jgi:hypothetical protein
MVCRMCEEYIPVMVVREHSQLCSEQMALKDRVIELRGVVKELLEEVKSEEMESIR